MQTKPEQMLVFTLSWRPQKGLYGGVMIRHLNLLPAWPTANDRRVGANMQRSICFWAFRFSVSIIQHKRKPSLNRTDLIYTDRAAEWRISILKKIQFMTNFICLE